MQDPISDMLTRIRNAGQRRKKNVLVPFSRFKLNILQVLKSEGYITDFEIDSETKYNISVTLSYYLGVPVIEQIKRISKPSLRRYARSSDLKPIKAGLGLAIISTSEGVMSSVDAKKKNIGGELVCQVS